MSRNRLPWDRAVRPAPPCRAGRRDCAHWRDPESRSRIVRRQPREARRPLYLRSVRRSFRRARGAPSRPAARRFQTRASASCCNPSSAAIRDTYAGQAKPVSEVFMRCDRLWHNARLLTLAPNSAGLGRVEKAVIAAEAATIIYAGPASEAPSFDVAERIDCEGRWITPGLIDCHTHL